MMNENHVSDLLIDYVLNLLPSPQRQLVEHHAAVCAECRQALQEERALAPLVRQTLSLTGRSTPARLGALMPAAPTRQTAWLFTWQRQLALISAVMILFLAGLSWRQASSLPAWQDHTPTALSVTATSTQVPTATNSDIDVTAAPDVPARATTARQPAAAPINRPAATPIAALIQPQSNP